MMIGAMQTYAFFGSYENSRQTNLRLIGLAALMVIEYGRYALAAKSSGMGTPERRLRMSSLGVHPK